MRVKIPFRNEFEKVLLSGQKTMTSRTSRMGEHGDTFVAFGVEFQIEAVGKFALGYVADEFWRQEGTNSREEFIEVWKQIHPWKGYQPQKVVWVHQFARVVLEGDKEK